MGLNLHAPPVRGESHIQRNASGEIASISVTSKWRKTQRRKTKLWKQKIISTLDCNRICKSFHFVHFIVLFNIVMI